MPPTGFEHTIPANELSQTHALDRAATEICKHRLVPIKNQREMFLTSDFAYGNVSKSDKAVVSPRKIQSRFFAEKGVHRALYSDIWSMTDKTQAPPSQSNMWDYAKISSAK
jgi:hypothetical protein